MEVWKVNIFTPSQIREVTTFSLMFGSVYECMLCVYVTVCIVYMCLSVYLYVCLGVYEQNADQRFITATAVCECVSVCMSWCACMCACVCLSVSKQNSGYTDFDTVCVNWFIT